jgi:hypothetical protein
LIFADLSKFFFYQNAICALTCNNQNHLRYTLHVRTRLLSQYRAHAYGHMYQNCIPLHTLNSVPIIWEKWPQRKTRESPGCHGQTLTTHPQGRVHTRRVTRAARAVGLAMQPILRSPRGGPGAVVVFSRPNPTLRPARGLGGGVPTCPKELESRILGFKPSSYARTSSCEPSIRKSHTAPHLRENENEDCQHHICHHYHRA